MSGHNSLKQLSDGAWNLPDPGNAGALPRDTAGIVNLVSTAAETRTLADPVRAGVILTLNFLTDGGDITLTIASGIDESSTTSVTFADAGDYLTLQSMKFGSGFRWRRVAQNGIVAPSFDQVLADDASLGFGAPDVEILWETADANANKALVQMPAGTAVNVPVIVIGQAIENVDMGIHNGIVDPTVSMIGTGAVTTGPVIEMRKARGTATAPTVVTAGDDTGSINFYNCVAAGEWVLGAQIRVDAQATLATTRGPAQLVIATATDAAPSVLTDALTISKAQLVTVAAGLTLTTGNITYVAAGDLVVPANTATAWDLTDGTTSLHAIDTRNTVTVQNHILQGPASQTLPNGATSRARIVTIPAKTITLLGTTQVTTENLGVQLCIDAPTIAQSGGAVTVDRASSLHIGTPVAGSSVTITANHLVSTGTAGCFCTAAGTWTDTCSEDAKTDFANVDWDGVGSLLDAVEIMNFRYKDASDGGFTRFGVIAEKVPDFLAQAGRQGVASRDTAAFAITAAKWLKRQNDELMKRLAILEAKLGAA